MPASRIRAERPSPCRTSAATGPVRPPKPPYSNASAPWSAGWGSRRAPLRSAPVSPMHNSFCCSILASGDGSSVRDLAAHAHTGQSAVSAIVGRLVGRRLVRRARSPIDGRSVVLTLTESGRALVRRAPEPPTTRLLRALADLDARELSALVRGLAGLSRSMRLPEQTSAMLFESPARRRTPRGTVRRAMRRST